LRQQLPLFHVVAYAHIDAHHAAVPLCRNVGLLIRNQRSSRGE